MPWPGDFTHEVLGGDEDLVEGEGGGVGAADTVLLLRLARNEPRSALLDDEEGWAFGRLGQDGQEIGVPAVGNELLGTVDDVTGDGAVVVHDGRGRGLQIGEVASGFGLGDGVRHDRALLSQLAEPFLLLGFGRADQDGVGSQMDGQKGRAHSQADLGHLLGESGHVAGAAAHPPVLLRDEEKLQADLRAEKLPDLRLWEYLAFVPLSQLFRRQHPVPHLREQIEDQLAFFQR